MNCHCAYPRHKVTHLTHLMYLMLPGVVFQLCRGAKAMPPSHASRLLSQISNGATHTAAAAPEVSVDASQVTAEHVVGRGGKRRAGAVLDRKRVDLGSTGMGQILSLLSQATLPLFLPWTCISKMPDLGLR